MDYFTPVKENLPAGGRLARTAAQSREGDWVCLNCNNLNFSFRKKCNRCKTQTRQQNEDETHYSQYYYYAKPYLYLPAHPLQESNHTTTSANSVEPPSQCPNPTQLLMTPKRSLERTPEKIQKDLPSVSPLIKKYNSRDLTSSNKSKGSSEGSVWGVAVREFEEEGEAGEREGREGEGREGEGREGEEGEAEWELQRMIGSIML